MAHYGLDQRCTRTGANSRAIRQLLAALAAWAPCAGIGLDRPATALAAQLPLPEKTGEIFLIDDFENKATETDLGFDYFMGNTGLVGSPDIASRTVVQDPGLARRLPFTRGIL